MKFTQQGSITVNMTYMRLKKSDRIKLIFSVCDTGVGMSTDTQKAVYEKFTQADASTTRYYGGTGLGLAITKSLVELMGGKITLKSKLGAGSEFRVSLPLQLNVGPVPLAEREEELPRQAVPHGASAKLKVLLVEDYEPNVLVATSMLQNFGYDYEVATSGQEALSRLEEEAFALILLDIQMPGLDGYETATFIRLRESDGAAHTPIIAMTANALSGDRERCLQAGMDDYLAKPFNPKELRETLSRYMPSAA